MNHQASRTHASPGPRARRLRSPGVAAFLSFLVPGLGQAWAGDGRRGLLVSLPFLAVVALGIGTILVAGGVIGLAGIMVDPVVLLAILAADVVLLVYRAWAIVDAGRVARGPKRWRRPLAGGTAVVMAFLLAATTLMHGAVAYVGWNGYDLLSVFPRGTDGGPAWGDDGDGTVGLATPTPELTEVPASTPTPEPAGTPAGATPSPAAATPTPPGATPVPSVRPATGDIPYWADDGRLNVLLIGGDAGPGRFSLRTDTMILLTVDLATARAAMFGIPRNLLNVPLPAPYAATYRGGVFPDLLNALWRAAQNRPSWPGNNVTRGYRALSAAVGNIAGVSVDGVVSVDLNGFVRLVDALGGIEINVPYRVYDKNYPMEDGSGTRVLEILPGLQRLDGSTSLAFARSRHQDSDYGRMSRQQILLLAVRKQINPCTMLPKLPDLVGIAKDSLYTNIPLEELPRLLALANQIDTRRIERFAFTPAAGYPEVVTPASVQAMQRAVRDAFKGDPPPAEGSPDLSLLSC
ncbi:MAG: LCP family protein [Chloroflexota bacterium]